MKYSVIMPVYLKDHSHLEVVEEAVTSIRQHSEDYELIIVDDGSPLVHAMEYAFSTLPDVYVRRQQNLGIAPSWNDGIKVARGEYLAIVNDDITVTKGWLEDMENALNFPDAMVSAPGVLGKENGTGIEENHLWYPGYCFMLPRTTVDTVGLFDEQFVPFNFEDTDYWVRVMRDFSGSLMRNYGTKITHHEGHVLHTLDYDGVSELNKKKFIQKHGFDPIPSYYYGEKLPWEM